MTPVNGHLIMTLSCRTPTASVSPPFAPAGEDVGLVGRPPSRPPDKSWQHSFSATILLHCASPVPLEFFLQHSFSHRPTPPLQNGSEKKLLAQPQMPFLHLERFSTKFLFSDVSHKKVETGEGRGEASFCAAEF